MAIAWREAHRVIRADIRRAKETDVNLAKSLKALAHPAALATRATSGVQSLWQGTASRVPKLRESMRSWASDFSDNPWSVTKETAKVAGSGAKGLASEIKRLADEQAVNASLILGGVDLEAVNKTPFLPHHLNPAELAALGTVLVVRKYAEIKGALGGVPMAGRAAARGVRSVWWDLRTAASPEELLRTLEKVGVLDSALSRLPKGEGDPEKPAAQEPKHTPIVDA
jgi:hypothetical protein